MFHSNIGKIKYIPSLPICLVFLISFFGICILCSINSGHINPWGTKQIIRLCLGTVFLFIGTAIPTAFWKKYAYIMYLFGVILLCCVIVAGKISMGAQRWLNIASFNFQPSEIMRILIVVTLAKYFANRNIENIRSTVNLLPALAIIGIPMVLVLLQPDLGTAMMFVYVGASIFFVCGVQIWKFAIVIGSIICSAPILWSMLHDYQKDRILMFLSPENDPNGAGYHIIQSQIALGSGGFYGKGLLNGTQCQLNFLPEKQTDFVFSALGEELGFVGCILLIILYTLLISYNTCVAMRQRYKFSQILVFGLNTMLFFYAFINISMVCGLLPVVGIPLPFFSYGGSALVVLMFCQGLIFSADIEQRKYTNSFNLQ